MQLYKLSVVLCALCSVNLLVAEAYPTLALPLWSSSGSAMAMGKRHKKTGTFVAQSDPDVLELENLRESGHDEQHRHSERIESVPEVASLPELERRLELSGGAEEVAELTTMVPATEPPAKEAVEKTDVLESEIHAVHRPPTLQSHDGGKLGQQHADEVTAANLAPPLAPTMTKPFYGAARLAFGQNPEVLPTTTTTSTSTSTSTTTTTTPAVIPTTTTTTTTEQPNPPLPTTITTKTAPTEMRKNVATDLVIAAPLSPHIGAIVDGATDEQQQQQQQQQLIAATMAEAADADTGADKESDAAGDLEVVEEQQPQPQQGLTAEAETFKAQTSRRSASIAASGRLTPSPKTMAQYVFWTGDEVGVARAVEEFIEQGLMTRESALKFLRDIRLAIENYQRSYQNKMFLDETQPNMVKKTFAETPSMAPRPLTTTTSTTTTTTTTPVPVTVKPVVSIEQEWQRTANRLLAPNKLSLPELNNDVGQEELSQHGYSSPNGRVKISELLYAEYTLEEILYKLAKAMFTQSLSHGSDETQKELQKLTNFLEREGDLGVIPIDLQKKILNVLLTALSDTLREHPELLSAANVNLASPYNRLHHTAAAYEPIN